MSAVGNKVITVGGWLLFAAIIASMWASIGRMGSTVEGREVEERAHSTMENTHEIVGWREELGREYDKITGHTYVLFSEVDNTASAGSCRKALAPMPLASGVDLSRRPIKGTDKFEVYIIRLKYWVGGGYISVEEYVVSRKGASFSPIKE